MTPAKVFSGELSTFYERLFYRTPPDRKTPRKTPILKPCSSNVERNAL